MTTHPKEGGCCCGAIRYSVSAEPITCYACHCTDCQTQSGSAFALSMVVPAPAITLLQGEPARYRTEKGEGYIDQHFCADCGTRLWGTATQMPEIAVIKTGTLQDASWVRPVAHVWTRSAQPWLVFDDDLPTYETQPDDLQDLIRLQQARA